MIKTSTARFEHKFLLNFEQYLAIKRILKSVFRLNEDSPYLSYPVFSLYFDDADLGYLYQKIEGEHRHVKVRLRKYSQDFFDHRSGFMELKIKIGDRLSKVRAPIQDTSQMIDPQNWAHLSIPDLIREHAQCLLKPVCYVKYDRDVYEAKFKDEIFRITFDNNIITYPFQLTPHHAIPTISLDEDERFLMEVKYRYENYPAFFQELLKMFSLRRIYFSKYASSVMRLGLG